MALGPRSAAGLCCASRAKRHAGSGPLSSNVRRHKHTRSMPTESLDPAVLRSSAHELCGHVSGVYFLYSGEELVYIGQGWNCLLRVAEHTRKESAKVFTHWTFVPVPDEAARKELERQLRSRYAPRCNKV